MTVQLLAIRSELDYFCKCQVCNHQIKHAYITDGGIMGRDCFLSAIGLPRVRNSQPKCPILPADQYESLAAGMLKQLEALTDQEWIQYWQHYYGDDRSDRTPEILQITRSDPSGGFQFWIKTRASTLEDNMLYGNYSNLARLTGIPEDVMHHLRLTKTYNLYYRQHYTVSSTRVIFQKV